MLAARAAKLKARSAQIARAVVTIQRVVRGVQGRACAREHRSARTIQKHVRAFLARAKVRVIRAQQEEMRRQQAYRRLRWASAIRIQQICRGVLARRRAAVRVTFYVHETTPRGRSASLIRAMSTCFCVQLLRAEWLCQRRVQAVATLQRAGRCWLARRRVVEVKAQRRVELEIKFAEAQHEEWLIEQTLREERQRQAAIAIQKVVRGFVARQSFRLRLAQRKQLEAEIAEMQRQELEVREAEQLARLAVARETSARTIQRLTRGFSARRNVQQMRDARQQAAASFTLKSTVVQTATRLDAQVTAEEVEPSQHEKQADMVAQQTNSSETPSSSINDDGEGWGETAKADTTGPKDKTGAGDASAEHAGSSVSSPDRIDGHDNAAPTALELEQDELNKDRSAESEHESDAVEDGTATSGNVEEIEGDALVEASLAPEGEGENQQVGCDHEVVPEDVVGVPESPVVPRLYEEMAEVEPKGTSEQATDAAPPSDSVRPPEEEMTQAAIPAEQSFTDAADETAQSAPEPTPEPPSDPPVAVETNDETPPAHPLKVETQAPSPPSGAIPPTPKTQEIKRLQDALARDTRSIEAVKKATKEAEDRARNAELALEALREEQRRYQEQLETERELRDKQLEEFRLMVEKATQNQAANPGPAPVPAPAPAPAGPVEAKDDDPPAHDAKASPESTPLPANQWQRVLDPASNAFYFLNEESGYATWSTPPHLQAAASDGGLSSAQDGPSTDLTQDQPSEVEEEPNSTVPTTTAPSRWVEYWDESVNARYW